MPLAYTEKEPTQLDHEAWELLDQHVRQIKADRGTITEAHRKMGGAAEETVKMGEDIGAGLVVMGSRGKGAIRRALTGSASDSVVRHAHCPVLVVRGERHQFRYETHLRRRKVEITRSGFPMQILLATEGFEDATLAARVAEDLFDKAGSELHPT